MIARMWRGWARPGDTEAYLDALRERVREQQGTVPGKRGAFVLCRRGPERSEIVTLSFWSSLESVRAFAGDPVDRAVLYPVDDALRIDRETTVSHFEVLDTGEDPRSLLPVAPRPER